MPDGQRHPEFTALMTRTLADGLGNPSASIILAVAEADHSVTLVSNVAPALLVLVARDALQQAADALDEAPVTATMEDLRRAVADALEVLPDRYAEEDAPATPANDIGGPAC